MQDLEKACPEGKFIPEGGSSLNSPDEGLVDIVDLPAGWKGKVTKVLGIGAVELRGAVPIPVEERTCTSFLNIGTLWFCMNANMLPITFGILGPSYGLGLRDSSLVIIFFTLLTALLPAYMSTLGPKIGMRQMIQARFSYGKWAVSIPILLNMATLTGFCIIMAVIGGQCLSAVSGGTLSSAVGIVIVTILSLVISFSGFKVLHLYEKWASAPSVIALIIACGCGGKHLDEQSVPTDPATAAQILSFAMIWLLKIPRSVFSIVITALVMPISIKASSDFFANLENFIALIGYWSSAFVGVFIVEHFWFRKADCSTYSHEAWDNSEMLPPGIAAIAASVVCFGLVIPTMEQVWWVGPIAETTGDLGFEVAFLLAGLLYVPFRTLEKRIGGR
ncbi:Purine-cytosine permease or related protein [Geosmithia morbida]|uniref:Purine-cytosine permease or related protein n=1 Tax=Geosmithia morbida TaxID=1094350 RepID=A0A9P4YQF8_9HYPO|nr:Purine-cytosine permease or related protein [Geosmithia morbida]KAF4120870.1 Purine-cytosine permease or related protein [Geosmithia morbida]